MNSRVNNLIIYKYRSQELASYDTLDTKALNFYGIVSDISRTDETGLSVYKVIPRPTKGLAKVNDRVAEQKDFSMANAGITSGNKKLFLKKRAREVTK